MDIHTIQGLYTLLMILVYIGIFAWAWSSKRKKAFNEAANLPLEDDGPAGESAVEREGGAR